MFTIVRIGVDSIDDYRRIRLRALQTDPLAFGSTFEQESLFTPEDWHRRTVRLDGIDNVGFFAIASDAPCALAGCYRDEQVRSHAHVISMWVAPAHRRSGVAFALLEAIRAWAESQDISKLQLMVTGTNNAAIALYRRFGFTETGKSLPYPNDSRLFEIEMARSTL